jgi:hypothetical protein
VVVLVVLVVVLVLVVLVVVVMVLVVVLVLVACTSLFLLSQKSGLTVDLAKPCDSPEAV